MGLTDRPTESLFLADGVYSLWTRSNRNERTKASSPATANDVHPFYMSQASDMSWFGVYTNLAAAQDWFVTNDNDKSQVNLTTFATGGSIDITIMFGANPNEVVRAYHALIGKPALPPLWSLGWGQGRLGYQNTSVLQTVYESYQNNSLPLETIWHDVDYMSQAQAFTIDDIDFSDLKDFVTKLQADHRRYIPIVQPQIALRNHSSYNVYLKGVKEDVFVKKQVNSTEDFIGNGRANDVVYPNFFLN